MADVLHRTTKEYKRSVNEPDYPLIDWIHNPDLSAVAGFPSKYWVIAGDVVTLMDQAARDAVDAAEEVVLRDAIVAELIEVKSLLRTVVITLNTELITHGNKLNALRNAISNASSLANLKTTVGASPEIDVLTHQQIRDAVRAKIGEAE